MEIKTIKELRALTGLSQSKFARYFNIPVKNIQRWELNNGAPAEYLFALMVEKLQSDGVISLTEDSKSESHKEE